MTLSNRITLAGALPFLVAVALAVLIAAIALAPSRPASAIGDSGACKLSPVILDMLLARYDKSAQDCDTLNPAAGGDAATDDDDFDPAVWDLSGGELTEFAISDDDADLLKILHGDDTTVDDDDAIAPDAVRYIDLTGNPLTIEDVDFANIPSRIAVILSADSNVNGFQATEYTVTEAAPSYIAVAFPDLTMVASATRAASVLTPELEIGGRDAEREFESATGQPFDSQTHRQLVQLGAVAANSDAAERPVQVNSASDSKIYYLPLRVNKNNDTGDEWDFTITINDEIGNATPGYELTNDEADITVLDADAPALSVCDRSEDVETSILLLASAASTGRDYGGHTKCDDLTLRDLASITGLMVFDGDEDNEPIADLIAGDFEGMANLATLSITGAGALPSGIFAGVGKDLAADSHVQISFAKNSSDDDDIEEVGKYTPSTIPQHIFDDQEPKQVIILDDDLNDDDEGITNGLDATAYAVTEGGNFFVMTPASDTYYVLGGMVVIQGTGESGVKTPTVADTVREDSDPKVVRFAIAPDDDDDSDDESIWLFLFDDADPESDANLVDLAAVSVADDD